tara:strand:+ start:624 stop:2567 length:1944 start_codon:yes stop_codon:yes gene_type:complete
MNSSNISRLDKETFMERMADLWVGYGNCPTHMISDAWEQIYACFASQLAGNKGLHVTDSVCGTGKTLAVKAACSVLAQKSSSTGGLIVVRFIKEADDIADHINSIVGEKVAVAFHSGLSREQRADTSYLKDFQFVIVTHTAYLASLCGAEKNKIAFRNWKWGERKFRVVDESLDLVERHSLTRTDICQITNTINQYKNKFALRRQYKNQIELLDAIDEYLHNCEESGIPRDGVARDLYASVISQFGHEDVFLISIAEDLLDSSADDWLIRGNKNTVHDIKRQFQDIALLFDRVVRQEIWVSQNNGDVKASAGQLLLPEDFDSLCILDATSNVDMIYKLFEETEQDFTSYPIPRDVRNFSNCKLHILPTSSGLGKNTGKKEAAVRLPKLVKWALETFVDGDEVLFAGHKEQMVALRTLLEKAKPTFKYDCTWWNNIDGKNTWKTYNKLVVTSLLFLPHDHSPTAKLAFKSRMETFEIDGDDTIASSAMAVSLIQLLCRIRIRTVIDAYGNCPESGIYLPLEAGTLVANTDFRNLLTKRGSYLLKAIEESLHSIDVKEWDDFSFNQTKNVKGKLTSLSLDDRFIAWIDCMNPGEEYQLNEFYKVLGKSDQRKIGTYLGRPTSLIAKHIERKGIVRESVRRKGTKFYYEA